MSCFCNHEQLPGWTTEATPSHIASVSSKRGLYIRFSNALTGQELFVAIEEAYISALTTSVAHIMAARSSDGSLSIRGTVCADSSHNKAVRANLELTSILHVVPVAS